MRKLDAAMLEELVRITEEAGRIALTCSRKASQKSDGTDVTAADLQSHAFLVENIRRLLGDVNILSEENMENPPDITKGYAIVIDPLDGTTNFKNGNRNFSVLLSVLKDGKPIFGVSAMPAYGITACGGTAMGRSEMRLHHADIADATPDHPYKIVHALTAFDNKARVGIVPERFMLSAEPEDRAITQRAIDEFKQHNNETVVEASGHILDSLMPVVKKTVRYRIYEAVKPASRPGDWDLAAHDAILRGAGGIMTTRAGKPVVYGDAGKEFKHQGFICWRLEAEAAAYLDRLSPAPRKTKRPLIKKPATR